MAAERVIYLTPSELEGFSLIRKAGEHLIYNCPYCPIYYGPNQRGFYPKLYFHPRKGAGYCFRCGTAILLKDRPPEQRVQVFEPVPSQPSPLPDWDLLFQAPNADSEAYLLSRSPYLRDLGLPEHRWTELPRPGVVFPIALAGQVYGYQIRFCEREPRYYTSPGPKLLYHQSGLSFEEAPEAITLVEGIFGSLGAAYLGLPHPLAIFGHQLTKLQFRLLKRLAPAVIWLAMDEAPLNIKLGKELQQYFPLTRIEYLNLGDLDDLAVARYHRTVTGI